MSLHISTFTALLVTLVATMYKSLQYFELVFVESGTGKSGSAKATAAIGSASKDQGTVHGIQDKSTASANTVEKFGNELEISGWCV